MSDILKNVTDLFDNAFGRKKNSSEHVDEETGHYWLGLFYFIGILLTVMGIFFILSFLSSENKKEESGSINNSNYQSHYKNEKYNDEKNQPKSKDSSELVLANVANKILDITGDPKTECSMPVFNSQKQYWVTNCDYNEDGERLTSQFSINLNSVSKLNTQSFKKETKN